MDVLRHLGLLSCLWVPWQAFPTRKADKTCVWNNPRSVNVLCFSRGGSAAFQAVLTTLLGALEQWLVLAWLLGVKG